MILGSVGVKLAVKAEQDIYELRNKQTSKQKNDIERNPEAVALVLTTMNHRAMVQDTGHLQGSAPSSIKQEQWYILVLRGAVRAKWHLKWKVLSNEPGIY